MEDHQLTELFWKRSEFALCALQQQYGRLAVRIAKELLHDPRDVEECVSDALLAVWQRIPPERPDSLQAYFCRIVKNQAMKRLRHQTAKKRDGVLLPLEELAACGKNLTEDAVDAALLGQAIRGYLEMVPEQQRNAFVLRYWYHASVGEIAKSMGWSQSKVKSLLFRMRTQLQKYLEKEGILP